MKGLFYKDFMLALPTLIVYGVVQLVLVLFTIILAYFGIHAADKESVIPIVLIICGFMMYFMLSMMPLTTFSGDATHIWQGFSAASPASPAGQVGSKYLLLLAFNITAFIIHILQITAVSLILGSDLYYLIFIDLIMMCGNIILNSLELPFYFTFGFEKGQTIKGASIMVVVFLLEIYLFFGDISIFDSPDPIMVLLSYVTGSLMLLVPIAIVLLTLPLFCLSMMLSIKLFPIGLENLEQ